MQEIASKSREDDHGRSIRERLKNVMDLFKVSRYKPSRFGRKLEIGRRNSSRWRPERERLTGDAAARGHPVAERPVAP